MEAGKNFGGTRKKLRVTGQVVLECQSQACYCRAGAGGLYCRKVGEDDGEAAADTERMANRQAGD